MINQVPMEIKIGQLMMFGFPGTSETPFISELITQGKLGGVVLFARNIRFAKQLVDLNNRLQELAATNQYQIGLFIAVDQEGGWVARLPGKAVAGPGNMALGAITPLSEACKITEDIYTVIGRELHILGVNMNLAPVLDVNTNPANPIIGTRSFGSDPEKVASLGRAAIRGLQKHVIAVAKHFPGHGDTALDSHWELPVVQKSRAQLEAVDLLPFRAAITAGVQAIMTAHIALPALDLPEIPATLSKATLGDLLRHEFEYDGLIITDCMEMQAISGKFSFAEAAVRAIEAGADIILLSHSEEAQQQTYLGVLDAVQSGRLSPERIDESFTRVMRVKQQWNLVPPPQSSSALMEDVLGCPDHLKIEQEAANSSVTVVRDHGHLPLAEGFGRTLVVETQAAAISIVEDNILRTTSLCDCLSRLGVMADGIKTSAAVSDDELSQILKRAQNYRRVIVLTQNAHIHKNQLKLVQELRAVVDQLIVVGCRGPFELAALQDVQTYIAAYSARPCTLQAVAEILVGKRKAVGVLPVNVGRWL